MGLFDFVGTFFFLSLGITFVLILLLVYHFKQRLSDMEQKSDKMFEIVNTIVKEMGNIRRTISQMTYQTPTYKEEDEQQNAVYVRDHAHDHEDDEQDEHADETDSDIDDEDNTSFEPPIIYEIGNPSKRAMDEFFHIAAPRIKEDEYDEHQESEQPEYPQVKVVSVDLTYNEEDVNTDLDDPLISDFEKDDENDDDARSVNVPALGEEVIHVNKLEETIAPTDDTVSLSHDSVQHHQVPYNKMNLTQLRAYVVSRGLLSDSTKLKKAELIKLLESNDE